MPIREFLEAAVARRREHPLLFFEDRQYTYGEFDRACNRAANSFQRRGIRHGERVVLMVGNCPEFLVCWMGLAKLGAIAVPMNPAYKPAEASQILEHADPRLAVATGEQWELLHQLSKSSGGHPELLRMEEVGAGERDVLGPSAVSDDDVAVFIYTSGTTGAPKAVMQTHRTYVLTGEAFPWWLGLTAEDRLLATLPLFHINAQAYSFMGALGAGASLILLPRFSASQFWEQTRRYGATQFNAVGAIVSILAKQPPQPDDADNPVSVCYTALAMSEAEHRAFERRFGLELVVGYGLSESTFGTITPRGAPFPFGTMGRPRQHPSLGRINEARVIDPSTSSGQAGSEAAAGKMGELLLRNPATMRGYFKEPELTEQTLLDGWLHTGDAVRRDEGGWFYFVDRRRDVIRRRGENLSSAEVEAVILAHPAVLECAVIGVPSELGEEDVKAFVVLNAGHTLDGDGLVAWCAERLADYKLPRYVEFRTSLPKTPTERVAKHLLRNEELGVRS
jgi:crotonobetaine/carnitine-CoA ligase